MAAHTPLPRLKDLGLLFRLGVTCLVLTLLGGYVVSGIHMREHYDNRDEREGFTLDDVRAAYHGISAPSPLRTALENDHPEDLAQADRDALLAWLESDTLSQDYDNLDLGDEAPAEIIAISCLDCHSRGSEDPGAAIPLEYWDDIRPLAFSTDIQPTPNEIIANTVPARRVEKAPTISASPMPKSPPKIGRTGSGSMPKNWSQFITWTQRNPPTPI